MAIVLQQDHDYEYDKRNFYIYLHMFINTSTHMLTGPLVLHIKAGAIS